MVQNDALIETLRREWAGLQPYQSIFEDGKEIVIGHRRDALMRMDALRRDDITGRRVLVLGCNNGHDCFMVAQRGAAFALGVDRDTNLLTYARRMAELYGLPVSFKYADLTQPFDGGAFDTVLAFAVYDSIASDRVLVQTLHNAGGVVYFEGHRHEPDMPESDYRAIYGGVLSAFGKIEPLCKTHDNRRWLYRLEW